MKPKLVCLAAPTLGIVALLLCRGEPPGWLLRLEVLVFSAAALAYGYTAFAPHAPSWFWTPNVRGIVCVYLGVGAMFCPAQFIVSAFFIGTGLRLLMANEALAPVSARVTVHRPGDIVRQESGGIVARD